jgi:hypothetical protein
MAFAKTTLIKNNKVNKPQWNSGEPPLLKWIEVMETDSGAVSYALLNAYGYFRVDDTCGLAHGSIEYFKRWYLWKDPDCNISVTISNQD